MHHARKEKGFYPNLRKYIREYNEISGIHGLRYLTEKRSRAEKIVWIIIMSISLSGCIYMIYEILTKYQNSPVVVSFSAEDTPIYEVPFPSVTICPETKFSLKKFNYTDTYFALLENRDKDITPTGLRYYSYINLLCEDDPWPNGNETINDDDFFETIKELAPEFEIDCYRGETYLDCRKAFTPILIDQGVCFSFNILDRSEIFADHVARYGDFHRVKTDLQHFKVEDGYSDEAGVNTYPRRALLPGADNSFDIYLSYNSNDTDYMCNGFLQGFRILIHNPWDVPHLSKYHFRVPLDKVVVAAVDPQLIVTSEAVKKFHPETRKCYFPGEKHLQHFKIYTQSNCLFECLTNYTLEKCGCVQYYMPREKSTPICGNGNSNCTINADNELKLKDLENKISGKTYCDCKPRCTALAYRVETSQSDFYWREYFKIRRHHGIYDRGNFGDEIHWSVLSIYFKSEQFMTLERNELYGTSELISNFGGLLGLFTGFSLMTVAEIVYFLTLRIFCNQRMYGNWSG